MAVPFDRTSLRSGEEPITGTKQCLSDYWRWAHSDLLNNTERGVLAEYLVGLATNSIAEYSRTEWDAYDLVTPEGITIEVKSAAYVQSWEQERPSRISFSVKESSAWDPVSHRYSAKKKRQAQVYVFCVFKSTDKATADPLDTTQWDFYVVNTDDLNKALGHQQTMALSTLRTAVKHTQVFSPDLALRSRILLLGRNRFCPRKNPHLRFIPSGRGLPALRSSRSAPQS